MNVKNIQIVARRHLGHLRREHQVIRRILEERVRQNLHFMEENPVGHGQPDRQRIADEVNVVPANRQFLSKFCRDDAASAVSGITRNADSQSSTT